MELARLPARREFSARRIFTFVLAVLATTIFLALASSNTTFAADAVWNGDSIMYDGHQYLAGGEAQPNESHGLTVGTKYYTYVETTSERPLERVAHVIYFAPGTDPPTETSGSYVEYDLSVNNIFSNPTNRQTITLDDGGGNQASTSCAIQGIGWIVCGLSTFLAQGMDFVFEVLRGFVEVLPVTVNDPNAPLFVAWNVMRSFANIAFIIAFLIIIYSQITGAGISSYGLKKLLPRLVIAALLVNVSYYIAAIAIDLSNVIGYSLQQVFISIRQDLFKITNDTWNASVLSWESIVGFILSGGTIAAGAVVGITSVVFATALNPVGLIFIVLPALMGLILAVLVVLLILAARQAIIIILVVIAPLAFVAYLLPNTEKWFGKWRDLFMTMLIFFPAFSLVFGGAQLAGGLIIQNANSINVMLFGMIVQVAPLVITPLLLKLSGSLLGRIAGLVNNPGKGLIDRTRAWTKPRIENRRLQSMNKGTFGGRIARAHDYRNRRLEKSTELGKAQFEDYASKRDYTSNKGQQIATNTVLAKQSAEEMQHSFDQSMQELRAGETVGLARLRGDAGLTAGERIRGRLTGKSLDDIRNNNMSKSDKFAADVIDRAVHLDQSSRVIQSATSAAQLMQQKNFAEVIQNSPELQRQAGGIDENGIVRAQAGAEASLSKLEKEALDNTVQLMNAQAIREGVTLKAKAQTIATEEMASRGTHQKQFVNAALEALAQDGDIITLREARMNANIDQKELTKLFARNAGTMKEKGGFDLQANPDLAYASREKMNRSIASTIGDVTGENISKVKASFWGDVSKKIDTIYSDSLADAGAMEGLKKSYVSIYAALSHEDAAKELGDRLQATVDMHKYLHGKFQDNTKAVDYSNFKVN